MPQESVTIITLESAAGLPESADHSSQWRLTASEFWSTGKMGFRSCSLWAYANVTRIA